MSTRSPFLCSGDRISTRSPFLFGVVIRYGSKIKRLIYCRTAQLAMNRNKPLPVGGKAWTILSRVSTVIPLPCLNRLIISGDMPALSAISDALRSNI